MSESEELAQFAAVWRRLKAAEAEVLAAIDRLREADPVTGRPRYAWVDMADAADTSLWMVRSFSTGRARARAGGRT